MPFKIEIIVVTEMLVKLMAYAFCTPGARHTELLLRLHLTRSDRGTVVAEQLHLQFESSWATLQKSIYDVCSGGWGRGVLEKQTK